MRSHSAPRVPTRSSHSRLGFELLESRALLACATLLVDADLNGTNETLEIECTKGKNRINLLDHGDGRITGTLNGQKIEFNGIREIAMETGDGKDTVTYTLVGDLTVERELEIELGAGNDIATVNFGGNGITRRIDAKLDIEVKDGAGNDRVTVILDIILAELDDPEFDNEDLDLRIGRRGGGDISLGKDVLTADITLREGSQGDVEAGVNGGPQNDILTLQAVGLAGNMNELTIDGGLHKDRCVGPVSVVRTGCES